MGCFHPTVQREPGDNLPARTVPAQNATNTNNLQQTSPQIIEPNEQKSQSFNKLNPPSPGINPSTIASPPTPNYSQELQPYHPPSDNMNSLARSHSQPAQPTYHGGYPPPTRSYGGLPPSHSAYAQQGQYPMGN